MLPTVQILSILSFPIVISIIPIERHPRKRQNYHDPEYHHIVRRGYGYGGSYGYGNNAQQGYGAAQYGSYGNSYGGMNRGSYGRSYGGYGGGGGGGGGGGFGGQIGSSGFQTKSEVTITKTTTWNSGQQGGLGPSGAIGRPPGFPGSSEVNPGVAGGSLGPVSSGGPIGSIPPAADNGDTGIRDGPYSTVGQKAPLPPSGIPDLPGSGGE
ncbi:hypothetical protein RB195_026068 [Necator americanus]|uniref:Uncharacterized protein n=1 Tax=Necator americanus TaxID=51031 RepID=A0ABR1EV85_NECAM